MKSIHRSWLVCLGGALALSVVIGLGINVYSAYQPSVIAQNGFTNAQGSLITTVRSLFIILSMLSVGQVMDRVGLHTTIVLGMVVSVLSRIIYGLSTTFAGYCVGSMLAGMSCGLAGTIPLTYLVARWFSVRRGYALGLASASSGIATIIAPAPIAYSIENLGLSATFFLEAGLIFILGIFVALLVRNSPEELGLLPYGAEEISGESIRPEKTSTISPIVWMILLCAIFLAGAPAGTGFSHLTVLYSSEGFSDAQITILLTYVGVMIMVGKIIYGQITDTLGSFFSNFSIFGVLIVGTGLCCLAPTGSFLMAILAVTGVALGLSTSVAVSFWVLDLSSSAQYEQRMRVASAVFVLGNTAFGPIPGMIADATGSYVPSYIIFVIAGTIAMIMIQIIYKQYQQ